MHGAIEELSAVDLSEVREAVGSRSFGRGRSYERNQRVVAIEWDPSDLTLTGSVAGTALYTTTAYFADAHGTLAFEDGECTCPVGYNCKHVAAIVIAATGERAGAQSARLGLRARPASIDAPAWERSLRALIDAPAAPAGERPLAIELSLRPGGAPGRSRPRLMARLMRPGARGGWVNGSLSWGRYPIELLQNAHDACGDAGHPRSVPARGYPFRLSEESWSEDAELVRALLGTGAATVIRVPLRRDHGPDEVAQQLAETIPAESLLFMPSINELELILPDGTEQSSRRVGKRVGPGRVIHLSSSFRRASWLLACSEVAIPRRAVEALDDRLWADVRHVQSAVAIPWNRGPDPSAGAAADSCLLPNGRSAGPGRSGSRRLLCRFEPATRAALRPRLGDRQASRRHRSKARGLSGGSARRSRTPDARVFREDRGRRRVRR